eukprot:6225626-Prymnesium_polylepis.1
MCKATPGRPAREEAGLGGGARCRCALGHVGAPASTQCISYGERDPPSPAPTSLAHPQAPYVILRVCTDARETHTTDDTDRDPRAGRGRTRTSRST